MSKRKHNAGASRFMERVEAVIRNDEKNRLLSLESLLYGMSLVYGVGITLRSLIHRLGLLPLKKLPCPVISVGNLTVGGTGKTPMTIYVTELLKRLGYKPAVVTRGYGGSAEKAGGIASDGKTVLMGPDTSGDEAFMMAKRLGRTPLLVGQNRYRAGMPAINRFHSDVIVLDDAYQHIKLKRDIDLVLLDHRKPLGNGFLLPRGTLREPATALRRADALIFTRSDSGMLDPPEALGRFYRNIPIFRSVHTPYMCRIVPGKRSDSRCFRQEPSRGDLGREDLGQGDLSQENLRWLKGRRAFFFSGIADNHNFQQTVEGFSCDIAGFADFADHHPYSKEDLTRIATTAEQKNADIILTTEKDYVRIPQTFSWPVDLVVIGVFISFDDGGKAFDTFIEDRLAE